MDKLLYVSVSINLLLLIAIMIMKKYYSKIVNTQDDICLEILNREREKINLEHSLNMISQSEYSKKITELISYVDKITNKKVKAEK